MHEPAPLSQAAQARQLTEKIRGAVERTWQLIEQAYETRAWHALGYRTWDEYCDREFGTTRMRLPREERREVVASMRERGMSTRAIASATGVARNTIKSELRQVGQVDPPAPPDPEAEPVETPPLRVERSPAPPPPEPTTITGTDGKAYTVHAPVSRKRSPLPKQLERLLPELPRMTNRLNALHQDDRFNANREALAMIARGELKHLAEAAHDFADAVQEFVNDLQPPTEK